MVFTEKKYCEKKSEGSEKYECINLNPEFKGQKGSGQVWTSQLNPQRKWPSQTPYQLCDPDLTQYDDE